MTESIEILKSLELASSEKIIDIAIAAYQKALADSEAGVDVVQWQCTGVDVVSFLCQPGHLCFLHTKSGQPDLVEGLPAHGRDVESKRYLRSFPVQAIL